MRARWYNIQACVTQGVKECKAFNSQVIQRCFEMRAIGQSGDGSLLGHTIHVPGWQLRAEALSDIRNGYGVAQAQASQGTIFRQRTQHNDLLPPGGIHQLNRRVRLVRKDKAPVRLIDYEHCANPLTGFCYKLDVMSVSPGAGRVVRIAEPDQGGLLPADPGSD